MDTVVSRDFRTAAILVELKERSDGFQEMVGPIQAIAAAEAGPDVDITLGGNPVYLDKTEKFAERINILFPIAILVIGLLHYEAFRTKQGFILPLVTAHHGGAMGNRVHGRAGAAARHLQLADADPDPGGRGGPCGPVAEALL